jgi:DNA repair protein RadC
MEHNRNLQMKNLPSDDRPYEKLERLGARGMTDAELLSVIIRSGTREVSALQLGQKIMSSAGDRGLMILLDSSLEELKEIPGIGRVKALQIKAALEIGNRTVEQARSKPRKQIRTPDDAKEMLEEQLRSLNREELHMIMLDIRNRVIRTVRMSEGGLTSAVIQPRDLFREAVKANAAGIILVHNHPSGDSSPSRDDIESTLRLIEMGQLMGIKVIDHLVIAVSGCTSLKQEGHI